MCKYDNCFENCLFELEFYGPVNSVKVMLSSGGGGGGVGVRFSPFTILFSEVR